MKKIPNYRINTPTIIILLLSIINSFSLAKKTKEPTAEQIMNLVKYSHAIREANFQCTLTKESTNIPFILGMKNRTIKFGFFNPRQIITLDLDDPKSQLREITSGRNDAIPLYNYDENIRGTDVSYEDIAMRFLYWPNPKLVKNKHDTWMVRVYNPQRLGPYQAVDLWIHKKSGGIKKMQAYNWQGKRTKNYEILSLGKTNGIWTFKKMRIETYSVNKKGKSTRTGRTYLKLNNIQK